MTRLGGAFGALRRGFTKERALGAAYNSLGTIIQISLLESPLSARKLSISLLPS